MTVQCESTVSNMSIADIWDAYTFSLVNKDPST